MVERVRKQTAPGRSAMEAVEQTRVSGVSTGNHGPCYVNRIIPAPSTRASASTSRTNSAGG
jgi:hypothetical protein